MNIKIEESDFDEKEISFLKSLELEDFLDDYINDVRRRSNVPQHGLNKFDSNYKSKIKHINKYEVCSAASYLVHRYDKEITNWFSVFTNIIVSGYACRASKFLTPWIELKRIGDELHIIVREDMSIAKIKTYLNNKKPEVDKYLDQLPKHPLIRTNFTFRKLIHNNEKVIRTASLDKVERKINNTFLTEPEKEKRFGVWNTERVSVVRSRNKNLIKKLSEHDTFEGLQRERIKLKNKSPSFKKHI